jgi:hypothetical protein
MKRAFVLFGALCVASPFAAPQTASPKAEVRERQMSAAPPKRAAIADSKVGPYASRF